MQTLSHSPFKSGDWILFQGDSITDCDRRNPADSSRLGNGYVSMLNGKIQHSWPELKIQLLNRAVSGDRTAELLERWERDCLGLDANWLSLMIGVNDVWRLQRGEGHIGFAEFAANYKTLLEKALAAGPKKLVLMSPTGIDDDPDSKLNRLIVEYGEAVKKFAVDYKAVYVPAREALFKAIKNSPEKKWTTDGCHPTTAGHCILADAWWQAVCG